jgi:hypothetical protein
VDLNQGLTTSQAFFTTKLYPFNGAFYQSAGVQQLYINSSQTLLKLLLFLPGDHIDILEQDSANYSP